MLLLLIIATKFPDVLAAMRDYIGLFQNIWQRFFKALIVRLLKPELGLEAELELKSRLLSFNGGC